MKRRRRHLIVIECNFVSQTEKNLWKKLDGGQEGGGGRRRSPKMSSTNDFEFTPPPEAPVFEPTDEEFKDPLAFISKIRPIAERAGICKIKPPPDWQPPFAVDVDSFKFTPRIQRLNELEAKTRIKLNFLDKIAKFWDLQGSSLKIPTIDKKAIDLHTLYMIVHREGGFDAVVQDRKWSRVAAEMGYPSGRSLGSLLRGHYERVLYPYQIFKSGIRKVVKIQDGAVDCGKKDMDYIPHGIPSRQAIKPPQERYSRRSKRQTNFSPLEQDSSCDVNEEEEENDDSVDYSTNSELKKLQFFGAGPKMPGYSSPNKTKDELGATAAAVDTAAAAAIPVPAEVEVITVEDEPAPPSAEIVSNPIDQIVCHVCSRGDSEEQMLLCDGCDDSYHTFCLLPPLNEIPKGDWRCPRCIAKECYKSHESFGFEQATKEYSLQSFGEMADQFKSDYFNMPVHMVPTSTVEKEFWRIVGAIDEDVTVQYGADLHTMAHGSGFPTKASKNLIPGDEEYANSGWNLNVLPVLEGSVLGHINADISGMKIPWMYVGMCFATFCWHNEDHWSYSINYLHWGEPKTWYGCPGSKAPLFEQAMKTAAPELFDAQPDLLHQLVTIMNPNILMKAGVPVYRTNQCAGEFVVTFPRAYHSGFNQGYNFAEAVNFCPSDWLIHGRNCIEHYSLHHRVCVFSHDELICKMASDPDSLDLHLAAATYQDMLRMVENEMKLRKTLLELGIVKAEREAFELLPDDERQCNHCKTTCFLSAVTCACTSKLVCIKHAQYLCSCPLEIHCLRFRYTLDELPVMLHNLKARAESFDNWSVAAKKCLEAVPGSKMELAEIKQLVRDAEDKRFPDSGMSKCLVVAIHEAEKCAIVAQQIVCKKVRTRNRQSLDTKCSPRLTLEELLLFSETVDKLTCEIPEASSIKDLLKNVNAFRDEAKFMLNLDTPDSSDLESLLDTGLSFEMDLHEIPVLKQKLLQVSWLEEAQELLNDPNSVTASALRRLVDTCADFSSCNEAVQNTLSKTQDLLNDIERWEEKAKICLMAKPHHVMSTLEAIVAEAESIPAFLPNTIALKDAMRKAKEWNGKVESIQNVENFPYLDALEILLSKGRPIPVKLDHLPVIESQVAAARAWRERTARVFLKKNSCPSLTDILSPRTDIGKYPSSKQRKRKQKDSVQDDIKKDIKKETSFSHDFKPDAHPDRATFVAGYKIAEQREIQAMRELRIRNLQKRAEDGGDARYCVCRKSLHGLMVQCELCKDWFHATCVSMPKSLTVRNKDGPVSIAQMSRDLKFLCPLCLRSRRPRLETILSILVSLQKVNVRLPEGEALQCLTERAMGWQDRARHSLATDELESALAKLSVYSQQLVERAAREKTKKITATEVLKVAINPKLESPLKTVATPIASDCPPLRQHSDDPGAPNADYSQETWTDFIMKQELPSDHISTSDDDGFDKSAQLTDSDAAQAFSTSEHAYSSASRTAHGQTPKKHPRKSPLVPRQLETLVLELSPMGKAQLEELMMEGDLLEVSLDETQHIWRILQACKPHREDYFPDCHDMENEGDSNIIREKLFNKRKLVDTSVAGRKLKRIKTKLMVKKRFAMRGTSKAKMIRKLSKDGRMFSVKGGVHIPCTSDGLQGMAVVDRKTQRWRLDHHHHHLHHHNKKANTPENEIEDKCAAAKCRRPSGEVDWVQCDGGCDLWFHLICVGLTKGDVNESEDYICASCKAVSDVVKQELPDEVETFETAQTTETQENVILLD